LLFEEIEYSTLQGINSKEFGVNKQGRLMSIQYRIRNHGLSPIHVYLTQYLQGNSRALIILMYGSMNLFTPPFGKFQPCTFHLAK